MKAKIIILTIAVIAMLSSCVDKVADYHAYTIDLTIEFPEEVPEQYKQGVKIVLSNLTKSYSLTKYTTDSCFVNFESIEPGFYSATAVHSYSHEGAAYYLNGLNQIDLFSSLEDTVEMVLSKTNALVIKQYYYGGCLTPAGNAYSADQFIEIHNNSDLLQYVDGISIIEHECYANEENYWTFLEDTIVARSIFTIPGDGEDYPVQPGESVVIARDGINHQDDSLGNPLSPVNLENADFEFWIYRETGGDLNSPTVDNMVENLFTFRGSDVVYHTRGGSAIAIASIPGTQAEKQEFIDKHQILKDEGSTRYYGKIPNKYVLDAVEVTWDEAHAIYKRFPLELDAGYTYVPAGSKSGLCVRRAVDTIIDFRYIYKDTNNSTEDFLKDVTPKPWINEE